MYYHTCEKCGANLDPGEVCDCEKVQTEEMDEDDIKATLLRDIREKGKVTTRDLVRTVRELYPRYDKSLQSKCERSAEYGISIRNKAMAAILAKYSPEIVEKVKRQRDGYHKFRKKVECRLPDDEYDRLQQRIRREGYVTMQSWLRAVIQEYIKK